MVRSFSNAGRERALSLILFQLELCRYQDPEDLCACSCPTQDHSTLSQQRWLRQPGLHGGTHKLQPSSCVSNSPDVRASSRMLLVHQSTLPKTAVKLHWQEPSSWRPTFHLQERALPTQLHQPRLCCGPPKKITAHPAPREPSRRTVHIIAIEKKSMSG